MYKMYQLKNQKFHIFFKKVEKKSLFSLFDGGTKFLVALVARAIFWPFQNVSLLEHRATSATRKSCAKNFFHTFQTPKIDFQRSAGP